MNLLRRLLKMLGANYRYTCLACGWLGDVCSWTDSSDPTRSHYPICPRCHERLNRKPPAMRDGPGIYPFE